ncbi:lysophospholipid acyltransferase family protein [Bordetella petrii]|uniref:lysophospholipid acyltransferase family protein n=1 Tax=Bordetella petrii TaxID=94624 RepID=UPI001E32C021|nr:hypothetical protein [Bordetella petrii]MCD0501718.1 hypothetical protein [Bordetella petrii]
MAPRRQRNVPRVKPASRLAAGPPKLQDACGDASARRRWRQYWIHDPVAGLGEFAVYYLFRCLPIGLCSALGAWRGRYTGQARRANENQARQALPLVAPLLPTAQAEQVIRQLHRNAGRALLETLIMDRICDSARVTALPAQRLQQLQAQSTSRIFVSVHTGNLGDLLGMCLMRIVRVRGMTVSRILPNRFRQRLSEKLRGKHGADILEPGLKATRQLVTHLRQPGSTVLIHLDEARRRQIYFPTFGRPLPYGSNLSLAIRLSAATGAPLVPVYMRRLKGSKFELHILDDIPAPAPNDDPHHIELARDLDMLFTRVISEQIADWQQLYFVRPEPEPILASSSQ